MPEIITKYPQLAIQILKSAGMHCGTNAKQTILTSCPPNRFCANSTGEICVYGLNEIHKMTQVTSLDFYFNILFAQFKWPNFMLLTMIFLAGLFAGTKLRKKA